MVAELREIDQPAAMLLCNTCLEEYVWKCDSCGRQIALPDIEGGEVPGCTPLEFETWCQACCDEECAWCDECGKDDLVKDQ
jgi:hypothetical protein